MIVVDHGPVRAAIIAAVEAAFLRFDQRVNDIRIGAGNGHADAAERTSGMPLPSTRFQVVPSSFER